MIAFYTQQSIKSFTEFGTKLCFVSSHGLAQLKAKVTKRSPRTGAGMTYPGNCNPLAFPASQTWGMGNLGGREQPLIQKKHHRKENKITLCLQNYGISVAIVYYWESFLYLVQHFIGLTNSAIGSYSKEKSSDFCLWREPRWHEYLQNLKWTI